MVVRVLVVAVACWWAISTMTGTAWAAQAQNCQTEALDTAEVSVGLEVHMRRFDDWVAMSTITIDVPRTWPLAEQLLWEDREEDYLGAMHCLLGEYEADERHHRPMVVADGDSVTVTDVVRMRISDVKRRLGFWDVNLSSRPWRFMLNPDPDGIPDALREADWTSVTVLSGIPVAEIGDSDPPPRRDRTGRLTWESATGPPSVDVELNPPRSMALAAWLGTEPHWVIANGMYALADLIVYVPATVIAWRLRRRAGRRSGVGRAATWLLRIVTALAAAYGLIFVWSAVTQWVWWVGREQLGDTLAIWESVSWIFVLTVVAWFVWAPQLQRAKRGVLVAIGAAISALGLLAGFLMIRGEDEIWGPSATRPLGVDVLPILVGSVAGLLLIAAYAGAVVRVWRAGGWTLTPTVRNLGLVLLGLGTLLAVISPVQYAAYYLAWEDVVRWLSDGIGLWEEAVHYPRWMIELATIPLWMLAALAVLGLLHQRVLAGFPMAVSDRCLAVFLFVLVAVWWPDWYAGLYVPLAALLTYGVLLLFLFLWRSRTVSALISGHPKPGAGDKRRAQATLVERALRYSQLEAQGKRLETRWSSGDAELTVEGYHHEQSELRSRMAESQTSAGLQGSAFLTPVDVYLASGPKATPWGNGIAAAESALIPSLLATAYMLVVAWRHGTGLETLNGWFGPTQLIMLNTTMEFLFWLGIAFVLGFLWRELPGARGYAKPWLLIAAYSVGAAGHYVLLRVLQQSPPEGQVTRIMLMVLFLTIVAVLVDLRALDALRDAWSARLGPLVAIYRVGAVSTTVAFLLAQAVAAFGLWQQLRSGTGISPPGPGPSGTGAGR
jgi:Family of unknown function (DUF6185)